MANKESDPSILIDPRERLYKIDTGNIFSELQDKWKGYDEAFLLSEVQNAYVTMLSNKQVFRSIDDSEKSREETIHGLEQQYITESKRIAGSEIAFPFPDFFVVEGKGEAQVIDYSASCRLGLEDYAFRLFFSLQLSLTDILEVKSFLAFHLETTFENDEIAFIKYVSDCQKKYPSLFTEIYSQEIKEFVDSLDENQTEQKMGSEAPDQVNENNEYTLKRQVLMMHYLFQKLGVTRHTSNLTDMARVIQGLTGRQLNAKDIRNTEIYKRLANPLKDATKGSLKEDLIFVRNIFEKLGLTDIAEEISGEIRSKE